MLVITCHAGANRYAVPAADVIEVAPFVPLDAVSGAPDWIAGVFAYRGAATPVLDLTWLATGKRCPQRWSSRILVLRVSHNGIERPVGLVAERVTTDQLGSRSKESAGVAPWGKLVLDEKGMVQIIDLSRLLPDEQRERLFGG